TTGATPLGTAGTDTNSVELGMKFTADQAGFITGARFYKLASNTSTHTAHLWTSTGGLLATATFAGESVSGWQQVSFGSAVAITGGTTYVISYFTPGGHYAVDQNYFTGTITNGVMHAP